MARNEATLRFRGDDSDLVGSLNNVGDEVRGMATDIDLAARDSSASLERLETDANSGLSKLNDGVDGSVGKFRGFKDTIDGTTDIADGFRNGDVSQILGGFADLADGVGSVILPKLNAMFDAMKNKLPAAAGEMALASEAASGRMGAAFGGILGKAGVIGLTLFGLIEGARQAKAAIDDIASGKGIVESITKPRGPLSPLGDPIEDFKDWVGSIFHTGGIVPGPAGKDVPMVLQAGEMVIPRGQDGPGGGVTINVGGSVITERDFGRMVADALRNNNLIGVVG